MKILINGKPLSQDDSSNINVGVDKHGTSYVECIDESKSTKEQERLLKSLQRSRY